MRRVLAASIVFALTVLIATQAGSQPQDKNGKDEKGPPKFELGSVLPRFVRFEIDLTEDQTKEIAELEKEVKAKLSKILTAEQIKKIDTLRPPVPGGKGPMGRTGKGNSKPDP